MMIVTVGLRQDRALQTQDEEAVSSIVRATVQLLRSVQEEVKARLAEKPGRWTRHIVVDTTSGGIPSPWWRCPPGSSGTTFTRACDHQRNVATAGI